MLRLTKHTLTVVPEFASSRATEQCRHTGRDSGAHLLARWWDRGACLRREGRNIERDLERIELRPWVGAPSIRLANVYELAWTAYIDENRHLYMPLGSGRLDEREHLRGRVSRCSWIRYTAEVMTRL
jgi:hypothetical protein